MFRRFIAKYAVRIGWVATSVLGLGCHLVLDPSSYEQSTDAGSEPELPDSALDPDSDAAVSDAGTLVNLPLAGRGLVARYYIDEADSGQAEGVLEDASGDSLDLVIETDGSPVYSGDVRQRGLEWHSAGSGGRASVGLEDSEFVDRLDDRSEFSVEFVLTVEAAGAGGDSYIMDIGRDDQLGALSVVISDDNILSLLLNHDPVFSWSIEDAIGIRTVMQVDVDTTEQALTDRVRFYLNGDRLNPIGQPELSRNTTVNIWSGQRLTIGNHRSLPRSIAGRIHYVAIYNQDLRNGEITENATVLGDRDDRILD